MAIKNKNFTVVFGVDLDTSPQELQKQLNEKAKGVKFSVDTKDAKKNVDDLGKSADDVALSFQAANFVMRKSLQIFSEMASEVYDLNGAIVELRKVSELQGESLSKYVDSLEDAGKEVYRTTSQMVEAATEFKKSGFTDEESLNLATTASMLQNVADEALSAADASNLLISSMVAFDIPAEQAAHIADAINATSNAFAVSSGQIIQALPKMSAALVQTNTSFEESIGLNLVGQLKQG